MMAANLDRSAAARWMNSLDDVDARIARLAVVCQVRILEPGVVERVMRNDASVCGARNPFAFSKLRDMVAMHCGICQWVAMGLGEAPASCVEQQVVDRLRARFPGLAAELPPAAR
jgi:hypothetical protein